MAKFLVASDITCEPKQNTEPQNTCTVAWCMFDKMESSLTFFHTTFVGVEQKVHLCGKSNQTAYESVQDVLNVREVELQDDLGACALVS